MKKLHILLTACFALAIAPLTTIHAGPAKDQAAANAKRAATKTRNAAAKKAADDVNKAASATKAAAEKLATAVAAVINDADAPEAVTSIEYWPAFEIGTRNLEPFGLANAGQPHPLYPNFRYWPAKFESGEPKVFAEQYEAFTVGNGISDPNAAMGIQWIEPTTAVSGRSYTVMIGNETWRVATPDDITKMAGGDNVQGSIVYRAFQNKHPFSDKANAFLWLKVVEQ